MNKSNPLLPVIGWVCFYLLLVLAPLFILLMWNVPAGSGFWWDLSMALGFSAMAMMGVQFLLTARFRRITQFFGIDLIYYFHRYLAVLAVALVVLHYLLIKINNPEALGILNPFEAPWYMTAGRLALLLFMLIIITSLWRKQLKIHYDEWRLLHIALSVGAFIIALIHIEGVGYYINAPAKQWLWGVYTSSWLLLIIYIRILKPWKMYNSPYRVADVRAEGSCTYSLVLEPCNKDLTLCNNRIIKFKPGQFAWLTLKESPWHIHEHPFSISSSAENNHNIEFTIKELGDFTRTIKHTRIGEIAYLDGPYGVFTIDQYPQASGYVFIAGGVGIAPMISMLRTLADRKDKRPVVFIYANEDWYDVIYRDELESLKQSINLQLVHVIKNPPENWKGETGLVTKELLTRTLPGISSGAAQQYEYLLCGPKPMSDSVQRALHDLNVPFNRIHFELFDMV